MAQQSKRIKAFREQLIRELPFFPNDRATRDDLKSASLNDLLIHWLHWKSRFIKPIPRQIRISPEVTRDRRWKSLRSPIKALERKIRSGESLAPYLSERVFRYGYTPISRKNDLEDRWADKDMLLNTKGFYHLHLGTAIRPSKWHKEGLADRTNELLFAYVRSDVFHMVGIFDHSVFHSSNDGAPLSPERERMYRVAEEHETFGMQPGSVYIPGRGVTTSGHPIDIVRLGDHYANMIESEDPKVDDVFYLERRCGSKSIGPHRNIKLKWALNHMDLGLLDGGAKRFFVLEKYSM